MVLVALGGACISIQAPPFMRPAPERAWPATLKLAQQRAGERSYDAADSILADFAKRYPGTPQAMETAYWRALYKLDPINPHASLMTAVASLDGYIGSGAAREHEHEAETIRRLAAQLQNLNKLAANAMVSAKEEPSQPSQPAQPAEPAKASADQPASADAEIKRLKDELAKANAELDRIKRRLAQPPGKP